MMTGLMKVVVLIKPSIINAPGAGHFSIDLLGYTAFRFSTVSRESECEGGCGYPRTRGESWLNGRVVDDP
jgi:hypothetical protein